LIVNISSVSGRIATPFHGGYSATKFALEALSDALRVEVQPFGVRVVLIEPGPVGTDFGATAAAESGSLLTDSRSPYASQYKAYLRSNQRAHAQEWTPDAVADVVLRAVQSPSPGHRYGAYNFKYGAAIQIGKLSSWLLDRILLRNMRLGDDT
jgi:NAD(P)-dependent dehydrogenase (short-subunit alcohol dehydrogenase family)